MSVACQQRVFSISAASAPVVSAAKALASTDDFACGALAAGRRKQTQVFLRASDHVHDHYCLKHRFCHQSYHHLRKHFSFTTSKCIASPSTTLEVDKCKQNKTDSNPYSLCVKRGKKPLNNNFICGLTSTKSRLHHWTKTKTCARHSQDFSWPKLRNVTFSTFIRGRLKGSKRSTKGRRRHDKPSRNDPKKDGELFYSSWSKGRLKFYNRSTTGRLISISRPRKERGKHH